MPEIFLHQYILVSTYNFLAHHQVKFMNYTKTVRQGLPVLHVAPVMEVLPANQWPGIQLQRPPCGLCCLENKLWDSGIRMLEVYWGYLSGVKEEDEAEGV